MVDQLKKPLLFKSKSFSTSSTKRGLNEWKQQNDVRYSPSKIWRGPPCDFEMVGKDEYQNQIDLPIKSEGANIPTCRMSRSDYNSYEYNHSPQSKVIPLNNVQSLCSSKDKEELNVDMTTGRLTMKRRNSFLPSSLRSLSALISHEKRQTSPVSVFRPTCPVVESDDENDHTDTCISLAHTNSILRKSIIPITSRSLSISPKTLLGKPVISPLRGKLKPPLIRTLSYSASIDTNNTDTDNSDHTSPTTSNSTPTSASSGLHQLDDQSVETLLTDDTGAAFTAVSDLDLSSRSTLLKIMGKCGCSEATHEKKMNLLRSMFLWHYIKDVGLTLNPKTIVTNVWMTLFDIVVGAVSITVEVMSYTIPLIFRMFETLMLWFVQQVYVRRAFVYLHETLKNRRKNDVVGDFDQATKDLTSSHIERGNRRPMRFLVVSKDTVRRKNTRSVSNKD